MNFDIDPGIRQLGLDGEQAPCTVLKVSHVVGEDEEIPAGEPVIGDLAERVRKDIIIGWRHNVRRRGLKADTLTDVINLYLPHLPLESR